MYSKNGDNGLVSASCWIDDKEWQAGIYTESYQERAYLQCLLAYLATRLPQNIQINISDKNFYEKLKRYTKSRAYFFGTNKDHILLWDKFDVLVNKWSALIEVKYTEECEELILAKKYVNRILEVNK